MPPTVRHRPETRLWILTGTLWTHAEKPSSAETSPLAARRRDRCSDTDRWWVFGVTVNVPELVAVPPGVVTLIFPVVAPEGTVAVILLEELTVKLAVVPLNFTEVVVKPLPLKFEPLIVTDVPTGPLVGENPEMVGATACAAPAVAMTISTTMSTNQTGCFLRRRTLTIPTP